MMNKLVNFMVCEVHLINTVKNESSGICLEEIFGLNGIQNGNPTYSLLLLFCFALAHFISHLLWPVPFVLTSWKHYILFCNLWSFVFMLVLWFLIIMQIFIAELE